ncbi:hypothetical protein [Streptomyces antibioticus]|uniref:hypothetical protein n=1 Tax=Streptomyces antibioticus TaxID=1890 RepID=UPI003F485FEA
MSTLQQPSADDFLMGGSTPSAKFPTIGTAVTGRITTKPTVEQQRDYTTGEPKFWDDGKPQMQLVVTLATNERDPAVQDDDGTRRLYVKGQMKNAVAQAVRAAGAPGLEAGGALTVQYTHDGEKTNPRFNAPKQFAAQYLPAAAAELHTPDPGPAAPAPAAPPAQAYNPAPVPPGVNPVTGEIGVQPPVGLTAEQYAAAAQNPATAPLLNQIPQQGGEPPF